MILDRYKTLCLYAFQKGVSLRAQTPNAAQNTKILFDSGMLYLLRHHRVGAGVS